MAYRFSQRERDIHIYIYIYIDRGIHGLRVRVSKIRGIFLGRQNKDYSIAGAYIGVRLLRANFCVSS